MVLVILLCGGLFVEPPPFEAIFNQIKILMETGTVSHRFFSAVVAIVTGANRVNI